MSHLLAIVEIDKVMSTASEYRNRNRIIHNYVLWVMI